MNAKDEFLEMLARGERAHIAKREADAELRDLRATPDDGRPVDGWRGIESAPKDGKAILAWFPRSKCVFSAVWFGDKWTSFGGNGDFFGEMPTHWTTPPEFEPAGAPSPLKKVAASLEAKADSETFENWKLRQALSEYPEHNKHQLQAAKVCEGVRKLAETITPPTARPEVECPDCHRIGGHWHDCDKADFQQQRRIRSAGDVDAVTTAVELAEKEGRDPYLAGINAKTERAKAEGDARQHINIFQMMLNSSIYGHLERIAIEAAIEALAAPKPAGCEADVEDMAEEGLHYFERAGDVGDKLYVAAIREKINRLATVKKSAECEAVATVCLVGERYAHGHIVELQVQLADADSASPKVGTKLYAQPQAVAVDSVERLAKFIYGKEADKCKTLEERVWHMSNWRRAIPEAREMLLAALAPGGEGK